jgi:glutamate synthase (NADPH/NADH) small chain
MIFRSSAAHEEGGVREYSVSTTHLSGENGRLRALHGHRLERAEGGAPMAFRKIPGTEFTLEADLILLAMGFMGPEPDGVISQLGLKLTDRGNVARDERWMTNVPGVFVAGDMQRGQSLIVWAIADGRKAAEGVHRYLSAS